MVLRGTVDGTAIDSTVLEWIVAERNHVAGRIRVIDTIGPSPIPPWVISTRVPETLRTDVRGSLLAMDQDSFGSDVLANLLLKDRGCEKRNTELPPEFVLTRG